MPRILAHRNRAVLPWIQIREITEHMILWGKECWWKQRRFKIHGKSDKLAKIGQSLCWESPAGHEFSPIRKKTPMLPKEELKSGRKCSCGGQRVHREDGTLRGKPSSSSLVFTSKSPNFSTRCPSQCHNPCAWAHPCSGVWWPKCSCAGDTSAVGWLCPHLPGQPVHRVTHSCCCCCQTGAALQKSLFHKAPSSLDCSRGRFRPHPRKDLPNILSNRLQWEMLWHSFQGLSLAWREAQWIKDGAVHAPYSLSPFAQQSHTVGLS